MCVIEGGLALAGRDVPQLSVPVPVAFAAARSEEVLSQERALRYARLRRDSAPCCFESGRSEAARTTTTPSRAFGAVAPAVRDEAEGAAGELLLTIHFCSNVVVVGARLRRFRR